MITYGYAKSYYYSGDSTLMVQVRIPSIHGPYKETNGYKKAYTKDEDLPYYQSVLLPHMPTDGEVVALSSMNESKNDFIVIGLMGSSYLSGVTDLD